MTNSALQDIKFSLERELNKDLLLKCHLSYEEDEKDYSLGARIPEDMEDTIRLQTFYDLSGSAANHVLNFGCSNSVKDNEQITVGCLYGSFENLIRSSLSVFLKSQIHKVKAF